MLSEQTSLHIVGAAGSFAEAEPLLAQGANVGLWDVGLHPEEERRTEALEGALPWVALVPDESAAAHALAAGARGVLLREAEAASLLAALEAVAQGLLVLEPMLASARLASRAGVS